jgi:hypothetical protein
LKQISEITKVSYSTLKRWSSTQNWKEHKDSEWRPEKKEKKDELIIFHEPNDALKEGPIKKDPEKFFTAGELGQRLGISQGTVRDYAQLGLPRIEGKYPKVEALIWLVKFYKNNQTQNKDVMERLTLAKAEKVELEYELLCRKLVPYEEISQDFFDIMSTAFTVFRGLSSRWASEFAEELDAAIIKQKMDREFREIQNNAASKVRQLYRDSYGEELEREEEREEEEEDESVEAFTEKETV